MREILKEIWDYIRENWAEETHYNNNGLKNKEVVKVKYLKEKEVYPPQHGEVVAPPPPIYTQDMLQDEYTNQELIQYYYDKDNNHRIVRVETLRLGFDTNDKKMLIIEYENK